MGFLFYIYIMGIQGVIKKELTKENIFKLISDYEVYRVFFGDFKLNTAIKNHLRGEDNKSFIIGNKFEKLTHIDLGSSYWKGDCIKLVQQINGMCSYHEALKIIDKRFNLGLSEKFIVDKPIVRYKEPENLKEKKYSTIQCVVRSFTQQELSYWEQYYINEDILKKENIYSIKKLYLNKKLYSLPELRFAYYFEDIQKFKVYCPLEEGRKKWISNVPLTYIEGKDNLNKNMPVWITKSRKDRLTLLHLYPHVISTQNESISCFSEENVKFIKENSSSQIVIYDSDAPGTKACKEVTSKFDMDYFNISRTYLSEGIVDPADLVRTYNVEKLKSQLKRKKLL